MSKAGIIARAKCWRSKDRAALVPDGDSRAVALFARRGQLVPAATLTRFTNAPEFFDGLPSSAPAIEPESDKPRRGRPPKA